MIGYRRLQDAEVQKGETDQEPKKDQEGSFAVAGTEESRCAFKKRV
jgi:hypothetical protein